LERRKLSGTDLTVSRACLGTMTFGGQADEAVGRRILDMSVDAGINFVDTANVYNAGESERMLGRLLGGKRHSIVLATKVGMKVGDHPAGLSRDLVLKAAEDSLQRLQTDYIDVFYLHTPDGATQVEETLGALDSLVRDGKVRYAATSNYASWQIGHMLCFAEKAGYQPARIVQPMYNLLARRIEDEFLPFCKQFGISTVVYNPLAGGLLTAKHNGTPLPGSRFDGNQNYLDRYWNEANHRAVECLGAAAMREGRSIVSLALNWLLHHTAADCLILGASRTEQIDENLRAMDEGRLSEETLQTCEQVWGTLRGASPKYNR
jgi:aryl-alcohol dehydrogenase-like predicted oxidoreductase